MKAVVKQKCPLLSKHHRRERLDFALSHQDWTVDDWKHVIWSDETKINCIGSDGRKWAWKKAGEGLSDRLVEGTVKFGGGSVMMWGCMTWDGVGMACKIDGKMDANLYVQILEDELQQTLVDYGFTPEDIIFQQDNDPKHTSRKAKEWLREHGFEVMVWPAQSPDLNPIEHLWFLLKRRLAAYPEPAKGILDLWERIQEEWYKIEVGECQRLIGSMPRRVQEVIKAKGGYTSY
jgi:DDE superfamily endonuclease